MTRRFTLLPTLVVSGGALAAAALLYTLARGEVTWALIPFLIVFGLALLAPHALQNRS